jgi:hypothetical protein
MPNEPAAKVTELRPEPVDGEGEGALVLDGQWTGRGEVIALQKALQAHIEVVRSGLRRCATAGTFTPDKNPGEWDAWQSLKTRTEQYIAEDPAFLSTVSQYERGENLQKEIAGWHVKVRAFGCDIGPAPDLPAEKTPLFSTAGLGQTGLLLIAILFLLKDQK